MTKLHRRIAWSVFFFIFLAEFLAGYYVAHVKGFFYGDAISRVANSFYVLYTNPPHLAAIGGVWNPLPSLFELPFMLLWRFYKPIATSGLAGVIFSSVFAAGSGALLYRAAVRFGRSTATGILLALLYCLHPFMFVYGLNGMTEVPFSFMLLWLIYSYTQWLETRAPAHLVMMALALMLAFLIRYEAIPVAVMTFLAVTLISLTVHRRNYWEEQGLDGKLVWPRLEAEWIILLVPVLYAFFVWVLYCWIILGNPLYFMNSGYSITAFASEYAANATLRSLMGHPWGVLRFVFLKTRFFMIPLLIIFGYRIWKGKLWKWDFLTLLLFVVSTDLLQCVDLWKGLSAGWLRYFVYPFPFLVGWLPYEMKKVNTRVFTVLCLVTLVCADIVLGFAWFDQSPNRIAGEEFSNLNFRPDGKDIAQKEVAQYLNERLPHAKILMDCVRTYLVIMNSNHPWRWVVSPSYQFYPAVANPRRYHIDYILVPSTNYNDPYFMDAINNRYPKLYTKGAKWCVLVKKFGKYFNLYRVKANSHAPGVIPPRDYSAASSLMPVAATQSGLPTQLSMARNIVMPQKTNTANAPERANSSRPNTNAFSDYSKPVSRRSVISPNLSQAKGYEKPVVPSATPKATPPDLTDIVWEGVMATNNNQIILIQYHNLHYMLHLGERIPDTSYTITKLDKNSATLSAYGKVQILLRK